MPRVKPLPVSGFALAVGQAIQTTLLLSFWGAVGVVLIAVNLLNTSYATGFEDTLGRAADP